MKRKTIFTLIAVILCLSFIGVCYALYATEAQKNVGISAHGGVSLKLNTSESLAISGLNPQNTSGNYQVELSVSGANMDENVKGVFYIDLSGELLGGITVSGSAVDKNSVTTSLNHETLISSAAGYQCALGSLPATVDLTFSLTSDAINDFASYANKTLNVTLNFKIVEGSVWTPDSSAYYLVGAPSNNLLKDDSFKMIEENGSYILEKVSFKANDTFKIYHNGGYIATVDGSNAQNIATVSGDSISVPTEGTYNVKYTPGVGVSVTKPLTRVYFYNDIEPLWTGVKAAVVHGNGSPEILVFSLDETINDEYKWFYVELPEDAVAFSLFNGQFENYQKAAENPNSVVTFSSGENFYLEGTYANAETLWVKNNQVTLSKPI